MLQKMVHNLRPHIVWFEEPVPMIEQAAQIAEAAEIFVVIGTSLVVYPAAGLVNYQNQLFQNLLLIKAFLIHRCII